MLLNELWSKTYNGYWSGENDNSQTRLTGLRRTRLTLQQIRQLRRMNDLRFYEYELKIANLQKQYNQPTPPKKR